MVVLDSGASVTPYRTGKSHATADAVLNDVESGNLFKPDSKEVLGVQKCSIQRQHSIPRNARGSELGIHRSALATKLLGWFVTSKPSLSEAAFRHHQWRTNWNSGTISRLPVVARRSNANANRERSHCGSEQIH
jgi:hypothetical protein